MTKEVWYCPSLYPKNIRQVQTTNNSPKKEKERQKKNEWTEREKTKQASSFGNLRLEWSACESGHTKES